jgi:hypothetical protein
MVIKQRVAVLAKHLATLRLTPQHAAIAVRMAISKSVDAHNYGVASSLLQVTGPFNAYVLVTTMPLTPPLLLARSQLVLSRNPPDAANLNEKLHLCKQQGETNAMPAINNPFCCQVLFPPVPLPRVVSLLCATLMKDLQTLRLVEPTDRVSACPVCGSHYAASAVGAGDRCPLCSFAAVVIR